MYEESNNMVMPVSPIGGYGNGGFGGDWGWIILLLLFAGGFGNGFGGFGGGEIYPWMNQADITTNGFQNLATQNQISAISSGIGDLQTQLCGGLAGVTAAVTNGFAQSEIANNARQIADMNQNFANQTAILQGMNGLQGQLAQCCCDNRLATCQTQNIVQNEANATRFADANNTRDIVDATNRNGQMILDKLCSLELDVKNDKILELQNQLNIATFNASQLSQNNYLQNALTAQTQYIMSVYPPTTTPATAAKF